MLPRLAQASRLALRGVNSARGLTSASRRFHRSPTACFSSAAAAKKKKDSDTATFSVARPFKTHKLDSAPSETVETSKEELLEFYRTMTLYRRVEIVADQLYKDRQIRGFCHLYDGQEAIVTGMEAAIRPTDSVITAYREHCHQISRGDTVESVFAELMGKVTGCSRGKGGSMHMYLMDNNFYGGNGIVGAQVPIGAGLAFAHKYKGDGGVAIAKYGDGASNQGQVFEAANMAALWDLPIIFVCENNQYGMGTADNRSSASFDYYTRGDYVPGIWVDGMDVLACKEGFAFAAEHCRSGKGPIFLEANTYRYHGHSMSDPGISYRTRDEVTSVRKERDPIDAVKNKLLDQEWATAADLKEIDKEVRQEVAAAVKAAQSADELQTGDLFTDIYWEGVAEFNRACLLEDSVISKQ